MSERTYIDGEETSDGQKRTVRQVVENGVIVDVEHGKWEKATPEMEQVIETEPDPGPGPNMGIVDITPVPNE